MKDAEQFRFLITVIIVIVFCYLKGQLNSFPKYADEKKPPEGGSIRCGESYFSRMVRSFLSILLAAMPNCLYAAMVALRIAALAFSSSRASFSAS